MFKRLFSRKGDVQIRPGFCAICGEVLAYDWMLPAFAANEAAYKCRNCGTEICMACAKTKLCPKCRGNIFDRTTEPPKERSNAVR